MINSAYSHPLDLIRRPRRNRRSAAIRALVRQTHVRPDDLVQPLFIKEGNGAAEPIASMPGMERLGVPAMVKEVQALAALGLKAVALFPQIDPTMKDGRGNYALAEKNWFFGAIRKLKMEVPSVLIIADVALDPYTDHGHDGVLDPMTGEVANDQTVQILADYAVYLAEAGADIVAPSDMMDGRVEVIRDELDEQGFIDTSILSYAAKFASAYYGPFRDAVGSSEAAGTRALDKRGYQLDPANTRDALLEASLDEDEGADIVMVKPAGLYLDIISAVRANTNLPVAAYQVSGEYAQIQAAGRAGWLDLKKARDESLLAIKRAGADIIFSYFTAELLREWTFK